MKLLRFIILLTVFHHSLQGLSQREVADSLAKIQDPDAPDSIRLQNLVDWAVALEKVSRDSSMLIWNNILQITRPNVDNWVSENNSKLVGLHTSALVSFGAQLMYSGQLETSIRIWQEGLQLAEDRDDTADIAKFSHLLGAAYRSQGNAEKALENWFRSLKLKQELGDQGGEAATLNNIGVVYREQGESEKALKFYRRSAAIQKGVKDELGVGTSYNNIGNIFLEKEALDSAMWYLKSALEIQRRIGDRIGISFSLVNMGDIYKIKGESDTARAYYNRSLEASVGADDQLGVAHARQKLGELYLAQNEIQKAEADLLIALDMANELAAVDLIRDASLSLYKVYSRKGEWKKALEMHELNRVMSDSILNEKSQKATIRMQMAHEHQKELLEIEQQRLLNEAINAKDREKRNIIVWFVGAGLCIVLLFAIFLLNRVKVIGSHKRIIEKQKDQVDLKNQEITDSITYAKRIQDAILPADQKIGKELAHSFVLYMPKDIVAGDFYWMETINEGCIFAVADCTGHGVPGAMVSVVCHNALNRAVREFELRDPGSILDKTRELVAEQFGENNDIGEVLDGMDIALCKLEGRALSYAGANNPLWLLREDEMIEVKATKQPIGRVVGVPKKYQTHELELNTGDLVYLFSDGIVDQFGGPKGKKFKAKALKELFLSIRDLNMTEQSAAIRRAFETWKGELEQLDDICVMGVHV